MNQPLHNSNEVVPVAKEGHVVSEHMAKILEKDREWRRNHPELNEPYPLDEPGFDSNAMLYSDTDHDDGPDAESVVFDEDETMTFQTRKDTMIYQIYSWLRAHQNPSSASLSSMPARTRRVFFELYGELDAHLKRNSSAQLSVALPNASVEAITPYFGRHAHRRWLAEVLYRANRAVAEQDDARFIPDDILAMAIGIATANTFDEEGSI